MSTVVIKIASQFRTLRPEVRRATESRFGAAGSRFCARALPGQPGQSEIENLDQGLIVRSLLRLRSRLKKLQTDVIPSRNRRLDGLISQ